MSNAQIRQNAKALNDIVNAKSSSNKLQKLLSSDNLLRKKQQQRPFRTEKSSTLSLIKSESQQFSEQKNFFKTSTNLTKLDKIITNQKRLNDQQHKSVIKHLLTDQTYKKINKISQEGNKVRTLNGVKSELYDYVDQRHQMRDLREKIKLKLQERNQEFTQNNAQQLNQLQLKITNLQATSLFKNFLIKNGFRQPAFLKDIQ